MEVFYVALKTTFPLLFIMLMGYLAKYFGILTKGDVTAINKLVYWILLPILLFKSVYQPELYTLQNSKLLLFTTGATLCVIVGAFLLTPIFIKDYAKVGVVIQALTRGNILYFGIPVIATLLGDDKIGLISIVIVVLVPIYNVASVIALSKYGQDKPQLKVVIKKVFSNPLIIAALIGMFFIALGIELPQLVMGPLVRVSKATTPIALILLGAAIELSFPKGRVKLIGTTVLLKLLLIPILVVAGAMMMNFSSDEITTIFAVFAAPTAVASYSLAREMAVDYDLAGQLVFISTLGSVVTIFLGTVILQLLGIL